MPIQLGELKLYSLKEVSKILGITTFTLRTYIRQGRLRARKMGTKWLITEDALREYFRDTRETKKNGRISLQGITSGSIITDEDIEKSKEVWK